METNHLLWNKYSRGRRLESSLCLSIEFESVSILEYKEAHTNNRISFIFFLAEFEGHPTTNVKNLPWSPLYCVLQQDEQTFTAYCSEELSVSDYN